MILIRSAAQQKQYFLCLMYTNKTIQKLHMAAIMDPETRLHIDGQLKSDVLRYITEVTNDPTNPKTLGIVGVNYQDLINRLRSCYGL